MAIFAVTFRIADVNTALGTSKDRWESVNDVIKAHATNAYWHETVWFYMLDSDVSAAQLVRSIDNASIIDTAHDLLVCIDLSKKSYAVVGHYEDRDLDGLLEQR